MFKFLSTAFFVRYSPILIAVRKRNASILSLKKEELISNFDYFVSFVNLFILHNKSFHNQGSKINKDCIFTFRHTVFLRKVSSYSLSPYTCEHYPRPAVSDSIIYLSGSYSLTCLAW